MFNIVKCSWGSRGTKLGKEALCFYFLLIHQNLGANFGEPKTSYRSQKQPVLSPGSGSVFQIFIAAFVHIFITLTREILFTYKHFSKISPKLLYFLSKESWKKFRKSLKSPGKVLHLHIKL